MSRRRRSPLFSRRAGFACAAAVAVCVSSRAAEAAVAWHGVAGCPSEHAVGERVRALAGSEAAEALDAVAEVTRAREGGARAVRVVVRVRHDGVEAERTFVAPTCARAAEATATLLALSATSPFALPPAPATASASPSASSGPEAAAASAAPADAPAAAAAAAPAGATAPAPAAAAASARARASAAGAAALPGAARDVAAGPPVSRAGRRPALGLGAFGALDSGALPGGSAGAGALLAATIGRARLEVDAAGWLARSADLEGAPGVGGSFSLLGASARACVVIGDRARVHLAPFLGAAVGHERASGYGASVTRDGEGWLAGPLAGAALFVPVAGPLAVRALVEGEAALVRPRFVIVDGGAVHAPPALLARLAIGPEVSF